MQYQNNKIEPKVPSRSQSAALLLCSGDPLTKAVVVVCRVLVDTGMISRTGGTAVATKQMVANRRTIPTDLNLGSHLLLSISSYTKAGCL
jgi:hypothetical protein